MFKYNVIKLLKIKRANCVGDSKNIFFRYNSIIFPHQKCNFHMCTILHDTRQFKGLENQYMYQIVNKNFPLFPSSSTKFEKVKTLNEFEKVLSQNYKLNSGHNATDILKVFKCVEEYCLLYKITLSDTRFDDLVDGLMDHCENLNDDELLELLLCLTRYIKCDSYRDHNFHDVWSCLNDICCDRIKDRSMEYLMQLADAWYELDLGRIGEFIYNLIDHSTKKANKLTKDQVVKIFFFSNVIRRKSIAFEHEKAVEKYLPQLSVDELGVIALGYFKSMSKIKLTNIALAMIEAVKKNYSTINQITLTSIIKVIRFTKPTTLFVEYNNMLDSLVDQIDRLSPQCCLHIAIIGSSMLTLHKNTFEKATQKLINLMDDIEQVRLKDIERLINASTMVDYRPNITPDLYETIMTEIHKDQRKSELAIYPKILPCLLNYLSIMNIYSNHLMNRVLDQDFIKQTYGKGIGGIPRDIFLLDCSIEIECPDYEGNRLSPDLKYRVVKWITEDKPTYTPYASLTAYDKLYLDVEEHIKLVVGNKEFIRSDHVTPHFPRPDIILCKDKNSNKFIEPPGFQKYIFGDVKYPIKNSNLKWYALSVIGWNNTIRCTSLPVGMIVMKQRHLKKMGYDSKLVIWNQFMTLKKKPKYNILNL
ncbi:hypothetical protein WA026_002724 [Henosepilachna vigintioctopunctata]|uniref:RAP domain-containing protein n=1 Tax=Henosepilachna vigintioctopunctata TaxID=420089 RepID=A0AAW1TSB1_9CUCU